MSEITKKALVSSLIALCDEKKLNKNNSPRYC